MVFQSKPILIFSLFAAIILFAVFGFRAMKEGGLKTLEIKNQNEANKNIISEIKPINILFVGDIMLDRKVEAHMEKNGYNYPFEKIKDFLNKTSIGEKNQLLEKASDYIFKSRQEIQNENEYHKVIKLPCPALDGNGACMIYEARPVICRKFGPPVYDYKNPGNLFACELNFSNGEEIIDSELIPNQSLIGKKWDELKTAFNKVNDLKENASTTIAEAILDS